MATLVRGALATLALVPFAGSAATIVVPSGTRVFGELDQQVTSNEENFRVGDSVRGRVWRNVVVDGQTVIPVGAPMVPRISSMTRRKIAGRGGEVEIQAVSVIAVDGNEILLDGGYDKQAGHRTGLAASLSALVAWPLIFIRGKHAVLDPGTVFDASVPANTNVRTADDRPPTLRLSQASNLSVEVLYDELEEKARELPLKLSVCDREWTGSASITRVNERDIDAISVELAAANREGECVSARGLVNLKALTEHFVRGINRFSVTAAGETVEVVMDVEM